MEYNQQFITKTVRVLIDGAGKHDGQLKGKSEFNQSVAIEGSQEIIGKIIPVEITNVYSHSLVGKQAVI
jgi:tRNA-2-methylthio-N6-dimethylallyladenosine synthase